jgi:Transposase DDE domain
MFLRSVKAPNGRHEYLRLVESVREGKKVKQRVVAHLGRKDQLAPHLDTLIRLLQDETQAPRWVAIHDVSAPRASTWGPILVARHLFNQLSLGTILDAERPLRRHGQLLAERIFPLLANRLTRPGSEHALAQWLEDYFVCNADGSRWMPVWKQSRRVKVGFEQLRLWYQSLDDLRAQKARIEKQVFLELRNLFSLRPDLVFYDITSTYFEGAGPAELGRFGYSRDGKPRNRQIVIGVVMMDGWPIAHHVFAGNRLDQTTVNEVVQDLNQRFQLNRVVFVGDRGMMTIGTVKQLRQRQQGYLLGLQRRNRKDTFDYIQQAETRSDWQLCPLGIAAGEKAVVPQTRVVEVAGKEAGVRVLVVHSEEREQYERSMRELAMGRVRKELEALTAQVDKGELKEPDKIGAAAAHKLARHHGHRYFTWEIAPRQVSLLRAPAESAPGEGAGRQVRDPDRRAKSFRPGGGRPLQRTQRSRAWLHPSEGLAGVAPDLSPQRRTRPGACVRGRTGAAVGPCSGKETARCRQSSVQSLRLASAGNDPLRRSGVRISPQAVRDSR